MNRTAEERPRFWGRIAGIFYVLNVISGSLALIFIRRELAIYADAANLTATVSYIVVTVLFYSIFRPANRRVSLLAAMFSLVGCAVGAMNSFRLATAPVNALVFFGIYCLLIGYLISKSAFLPRGLSILMVIGGLSWLTFLSRSLARLHKDESGQGLVEYVLIIALVAFAATAGMNSLASGLNSAFNAIGSLVDTYIT